MSLPIWRHGAFAGEFGDAFIQNTEIEGGESAPSIDKLSEVVLAVFSTRREELSLFSDAQLDFIREVMGQFRKAAVLDRELYRTKSHADFASFLARFSTSLSAMEIGERMLFTGGWLEKSGGHALMHVAERTATGFSFVICNTGEGVQYHPLTHSDYPKAKRKCSIKLTNIPVDRFLDDAVWYLFWKLRATKEKENKPEMLYEVLLPHLAGTALPEAIEASGDASGWYDSIQRSGTCYFRCLMTCIRYLLKTEGFSHLQQKQLYFVIRLGFLDELRRDLQNLVESHRIDENGHPKPSTFLDSDRRMVQLALTQTGLAGVKLHQNRQLSDSALEALHGMLKGLMELALSIPLNCLSVSHFASGDGKQNCEMDEIGKLQMVACAALSSFSGFGLIADNQCTDDLAGDQTEAAPDMFLDLLPPPPELTFQQLTQEIAKCRERCDKLRAKTSVSASSVAVHQICALVENTFQGFPLPGPDSTLWDISGIPLASQRSCLENLMEITAHYASASLSRPSDTPMDARRAITMGCIMAIFDATARIQADTPSAFSQVLVGSASAGDMKGYGFSSTAYDGSTLAQATSRMAIFHPQTLVARDRVLRYFAHTKSAGTLFGWTPDHQTALKEHPTFMLPEDDVTLKCVQALLDTLRLGFSLPPEDRNSRARGRGGALNPDAMGDAERRVRWACVSSFKEAPDFCLYRDMVFLYKLMLEPTALFSAKNESAFKSGSIWLLSQIRPMWRFWDTNPEGTVAGCKVTIRDSNHSLYLGAGFQQSPCSLAVVGGRDDLSEGLVLEKENLPKFAESLSDEESERLLCFLTAPYLCVPLLLQFFSEDRAGLLLNPALLAILECAVFEPRDWAPFGTQIIENMPIPRNERSTLLGTPYGVLFHEVMFAPDATLTPLLALCHAALEVCIGDFQSTFVPLLLFVVRFAVRVRGFFYHPLCTHQQSTLDLLSRLNTFFNTLAKPLLFKWLAQSEAVGDMEASSSFHAHVALITSVLDLTDSNTVNTFLCSVAYVVSWHSKPVLAKAEAAHEKEEETKLLQMLGLVAAPKPAPVATVVSNSHAVPTADVFSIFDKQRAAILGWVQSLESQQLDVVLSRVVSAALQRETPSDDSNATWRGWQQVGEKTLQCTHSIESSHPYKSDMDYFETFSFPGAPYISIYFDERTCTELEHDFITIYKDDSCTAFWGDQRKYSGREWPGCGGTPPLTIPADHFTFHFHSDSAVEDWGYKISVHAPVSLPATQLLRQDTGLSVLACQTALAASNNNLTAAREYVASHQDDLKQLANADSAVVSGVFRDLGGAVQINLQTAEVYLHGRMQMPVPADIGANEDVRAVFGDKGLFCAVLSQTVHCRVITIMQQHNIYRLSAWKPRVQDGVLVSVANTESKGGANPFEEGQCLNMPRKVSGGMWFDGAIYAPYKPGTCDWVSSLFDACLAEAVDKAKLSEKPQVWTSARCFKSGNGPVLPESLLMYVSAQRDLEESKGHPGGFFKISVLNQRRVLHVYALVEVGRKMQMQLVFTTDCRFTLHDLVPSADDRDRPWLPGCRYAAGNMFETVFNRDGSIAPRAGAGKLKSEAVGSVVISRRRFEVSAELEEDDTETYVPDRVLRGLIPSALLSTYQFWKTGPKTLRGYLRNPQSAILTSLLVRLEYQVTFHVKDGAQVSVKVVPTMSCSDAKQLALAKLPEGTLPSSLTDMCGNQLADELPVSQVGVMTCDAIIKRIPELHEDLQNLVENKEQPGASKAQRRTAREPMVLLDLLCPGSQKDAILTRLGHTLARLDNLSHILVWSESQGQDLGEECAITSIELPRLGLCFTARVEQGGRVKLMSQEFDGLSLAEDPAAILAQHGKGLPHAVVLEDEQMGHYLLVPNFGVTRVKVKSCPFSTELVFDRGTDWSSSVKTRFYVFPIHPSSNFYQPPSIAANIYLIVMHLFTREYATAAALITACASDVTFSVEERWIMSLVARTVDDFHPNAHACRLRLALVCIESSETPPWEWKADMDGYIRKFSHVTPACRLTRDDELQLKPNPTRTEYLNALAHTGSKLPGEEGGGVELKLAGSNPAPGGYRWYAFGEKMVPQFLPRLKPQFHLKYQRPSGRALGSQVGAPVVIEGAAALEVLHHAWNDDLFGRQHSLGFSLLYDMLTGRVVLLPVPKKIVVAPEVHKAPDIPPEVEEEHVFVCGACTYVNSPTAVVCAMCETPNPNPPVQKASKVNEELKDLHEAYDESAEGERWRAGSPTLAKLMIQGLFLKMSNMGVDPPEVHNMLGLCLLQPVLAALLCGKADMTCFPSLPYLKNATAFQNGITTTPGTPIAAWANLLLAECLQFSQSGVGQAPFSRVNPAPSALRIPAGTKLNARPEIADCANNTCPFRTVDSANAPVTEKDLSDFASQPLSQVRLSDHVCYSAADSKGLSSDLPFDLASKQEWVRRLAKSAVAKSMLDRLRKDMKLSLQKALEAQEVHMVYLEQLHDLWLEAADHREIESSGGPMLVRTVSQKGAKFLQTALVGLNQLLQELIEFRQRETVFVTEGTRSCLNLANGGSGTSHVNKTSFEVGRWAGQEVTLGFQLLITSLLSSKQADDLKKCNPFLCEKDVGEINAELTAVLFRSVRLSQITTVVSEVMNIRKIIQKLVSARLQVAWEESPDHNGEKLTAHTAEYLLLQSDYDEVRALAGLEALLITKRRLVSEMTGILDPFQLEPTVDVMFQFCDYDEQKTRTLLNNTPLRSHIYDLACRRCYCDGKPLFYPGVPPSLKRTPSRTFPDVHDPQHAHAAADHAAQVHEVHGTVASASSGKKSVQAMLHILQYSAQSLARSLTAARGYTKPNATHFDPRFLVFEFTASFMLHQRQVDLVNAFYSAAASGQSSVRQMIMGAGKTTVICPLLGLLLANGNSLVVQVVPRALMQMSRTVLRRVFSNVIPKRIYTLKFSRASKSAETLEAVNNLYAKLRRAREQRAIVVTTPEAIKSIMLKYIDLLQSVGAADPILFVPRARLGSQAAKCELLGKELRQNGAVADALAKIIKMWGTAQGGVALLDEVDMILHPLKSELNFPIGPRCKLDMSPVRWSLPIHLLDAWLYSKAGRISEVRPDSQNIEVVNKIVAKIQEGLQPRAIQASPHPVLLQVEFYHSQLKSLMADWALIWLHSQPSIARDIQATQESPAEIATLLKAYIQSRANGSQITQDFSPESIKLLNLTFEWISSYFPHVISKINCVAYGLLQPEDVARWAAIEGQPVIVSRSRQLLAIPFIGKGVPSRNSEFAQPDVLIGLTCLAYRYEGLRRANVVEIVQQLKESLKKEPGPFTERPSRLLFSDWLDAASRSGNPPVEESKEDDGVLPLELLQINDQQQIDRLVRQLSHSPDAILHFLQKHVFSNVMRHQSVKLQASGVDLGSNMLFGARLGFSGTPSDLLPSELQPCHYELGSEAAILRALISPSSLTPFCIEEWDVLGLLRIIASNASTPMTFSALIDTGALITGMSNEQVARFLLANGLRHVDACVFLDAADRKMVVDRSRGPPIPLETCGVALDRRFTFFDQVHTTGMDIKQSINACAVVTLGKDMTLRDYSQGCYRMRGLGKGQTLGVLVVREVRELIAQVSDTGDLRTDIVAWLIANSIQSESLQHMALCQQEVQGVWRRKAFRELLNSESPPENKAVCLVSRFFETPQGEEIEQILSKSKTAVPPKDPVKTPEAEVKMRLIAIIKTLEAVGMPQRMIQEVLRQVQGGLAEAVVALTDIAVQMGVPLPQMTTDYSAPFICRACGARNLEGGSQCRSCAAPRDAGPEKASSKEPSEGKEHAKRIIVHVLQSPRSEAASSVELEVPNLSITVGDFKAFIRKALAVPPDSDLELTIEEAVIGDNKQTLAAAFAKSFEPLRCNIRLIPGSAEMDEDQELAAALALSMTTSEPKEPEVVKIPQDKWLTKCISLFREELDMVVPSVVPKRRNFLEKLKSVAETRSEFLQDRQSSEFVAELIRKAASEDLEEPENSTSLDAEMVQEQEQEEQQQKEVVEQKHVQVQHAPNDDLALRWNVSDLALPVSTAGHSLIPGVFYPLSTFTTTQQTEPLAYPPSLLLSENYAPQLHRSDLSRRLKNVNVLMYWRPQTDSSEAKVLIHLPTSDPSQPATSDPALAASSAPSTPPTDTALVTTTTTTATPYYCVALSLEEAECVRRAIDLGISTGAWVSKNVHLRTLPGLWLGTAPSSEPILEMQRQCMRFFDSQMWFSHEQAILVLQALAAAPASARRIAFEQVLGCRRRSRTSWEGTGVAHVFAHADDVQLRRLHAISERVSKALSAKFSTLREAFYAINKNADGWISSAEFVAALPKLGLENMPATEMGELLKLADQDKDGFLNYREFVAQFAGDAGRANLTTYLHAPKKKRASGSEAILSTLALLAARKSSSPVSDNAISAKASLAYAELSSLGSLYLCSGGVLLFQGAVVSTKEGYRPTLAPRGVLLETGRWYYEVVVVNSGRACLGWAEPDFDSNFVTGQGVGDDAHSWGFDGFERTLKHEGKATEWGVQWSAGDVIGCRVDLDTGVVAYSLNGSWDSPMGQAFSLRTPITLRPVVSFDGDFRFKINFGVRPFRWPCPVDHHSILHWVRHHTSAIHARNSGASFGKLRAISGDALIEIKDNKVLEVKAGFPSVVLQGCLLTSGKWYYEVEIQQDGVAQIGWADLDFVASTRDGVGVGDDKNSWGFDGYRVLLWFNGQQPYGKRWKIGDVVGCAVDIDGRSIRYALNGDWSFPMGLAAQNIEFAGGLSPAITLNPCTLRVNFDQADFKHQPPQGYQAVESWLQLNNPTISDSEAPPSVPKLIHSVSTYTLPWSPRHKIGLRVSSGYTKALIYDDNVIGASAAYPSAGADRVLLLKGRWYYEATILEIASAAALCAVGFGGKRFFGDYLSRKGVGDDECSWGLYMQAEAAPSKRHNGVSVRWGVPWRTGDVVGCAVDLDEGLMLFSVNGKWTTEMGSGGEICPAFEGLSNLQGVFPAVSLNEHVKMQLNFGERPLQSQPSGFKTVREWALENQQRATDT